MREIRTSGSMRGGRQRSDCCQAVVCLLLYRLPKPDDAWKEERDQKLSQIVLPGIAGLSGTVGAYLAYTAAQVEETEESLLFLVLFPLLICGLCLLGGWILSLLARLPKR